MLSQEHIHDEINSLIKPGNIFYLFCDFIIPEPKWKYMLLVGLYGKAHFFVINSSYTEFIRRNEHLLKVQVGILESDYTFLTRNSYINCSEIKKLMSKKLLFNCNMKKNVKLSAD